MKLIEPSQPPAPAPSCVLSPARDLTVEELTTHERWAVPVAPSFVSPYGSLKYIAERNGVELEAGTIPPDRIYELVDVQFRARDVAFPGVGLSCSLKTFVFMIPLVVGATLLLLAYRLDGLLQRQEQLTQP